MKQVPYYKPQNIRLASRHSGLMRLDDVMCFLTFRRNLSASSSSVQGPRKPNYSWMVFKMSGTTCSATQKTGILPHTDVKTSHPVTRNCEQLLSLFSVKTIVRHDVPTSLLQNKFVVFRLSILSSDDGIFNGETNNDAQITKVLDTGRVDENNSKL
jgi:hypothetical protein